MSISRKALAALALVALCSAPVRAADLPVPGDADAVVIINIKQMLDSAWVKKEKSVEQAREMIPAQAKELLKAINLDPFTDIDAFVVSLAGNPTGGGKLFVAAAGTFDPKKIGAAAEEFAKKNEKQLKIGKEGDLTVFEAKAENETAYAVVTAKNVMVSTDRAYLLTQVKADKPAKPSKAMQEAMGKLTGKETVSVVAVFTDDVKKLLEGIEQTKSFAPKLSSLTGSITVTDALDVNLKVHTTDEESAKAILLLLNIFKPAVVALAASNDQMAPFKPILEKIEAAADKSSAGLSLKVTEAMIKEIISPKPPEKK